MTIPDLTDREKDILECLRDGLSNKEIAVKLGVVEATVKVHMRALHRKTGQHNRTKLALWWDRLNDGAVGAAEAEIAKAKAGLMRAVDEASAALARLHAEGRTNG